MAPGVTTTRTSPFQRAPRLGPAVEGHPTIKDRRRSGQTLRPSTGEETEVKQTFLLKNLLPSTQNSPQNLIHPVLKIIFRGVDPPRVSFIGGKLKMFEKQWALITKDENILQAIKGYQIPIISSPYQTANPKQLKFSEEEKVQLDAAIQEMIKEKVIREVKDSPDQVISNIFPRPKKGEGNVRPILNLKPLNQNIQYLHFKMDGMKELKSLIQKDQWLIKIDLKHAYWHIPIWEPHQKLMKFRWKEKLYQMLVLAFGLGPAPRTWNKVMKAPISLLRKLGFLILIYLDDMLVMANSWEEAMQAKESIIFLLNQLGLTINLSKSVLTPTKTLEYLQPWPKYIAKKHFMKYSFWGNRLQKYVLCISF